MSTLVGPRFWRITSVGAILASQGPIVLTIRTVLLAGRDATADFEDVLHSDSARTMLPPRFVGVIEVGHADAPPTQAVLTHLAASLIRGTKVRAMS